MTLKGLKRIFIIALFLLLITIASGLFFCFIYYQIVTPFSNKQNEKIFIIEQNESLKSIAANLESAKLIRNDVFFIAYVYYKGWAGRLQAGEYSLNSSLNIPQIAGKITGGDIISNEIRVTIPEGFTLKKIDARLAEAGLIKAGNLTAQSQLEGFLFPDTYLFNKNDNLDDIILKMKDNFKKHIDSNLTREMAKQGKTIEEIITMASILEKEVKTYNDKQIAAGIFWKRIADNYPLQSCATLAYILEIDKWRYSISDTKIDSPYNTYKNIGLPPGPICSPGLESIKAAIYPIKTDYNFFLSEPDGGKTIFSRTLEEHNLNKIKYLGD